MGSVLPVSELEQFVNVLLTAHFDLEQTILNAHVLVMDLFQFSKLLLHAPFPLVFRINYVLIIHLFYFVPHV